MASCMAVNGLLPTKAEHHLPILYISIQQDGLSRAGKLKALPSMDERASDM
jgi:hypothetical protein